ncbi:hypothetical protein [Dehalogenimonas alkenigignens]|uniref:hypothetical protein n=1 Tax=Dehalogenimonas alkenigignens TaxID=1217799 RepID=UPI001057B9F6|nr:hypothetical protein [Dehalogenimonas alkenigignens]
MNPNFSPKVRLPRPFDGVGLLFDAGTKLNSNARRVFCIVYGRLFSKLTNIEPNRAVRRFERGQWNRPGKNMFLGRNQKQIAPFN